MCGRSSTRATPARPGGLRRGSRVVDEQGPVRVSAERRDDRLIVRACADERTWIPRRRPVCSDREPRNRCRQQDRAVRRAGRGRGAGWIREAEVDDGLRFELDVPAPIHHLSTRAVRARSLARLATPWTRMTRDPDSRTSATAARADRGGDLTRRSGTGQGGAARPQVPWSESNARSGRWTPTHAVSSVACRTR